MINHIADARKVFLCLFLIILTIIIYTTRTNATKEVENRYKSEWFKEMPVRIDVYYETLCPDSIRFIKDQLWPVYKELHTTGIIDVNLYAYGNAHQVKRFGTWYFTCQHDEKECALNIVETCAMYLYPEPFTRLSYVYCVADNPTMQGARTCASEYDMDWDAICRCTGNKVGNELQHKVGVKTDALDPQHTFIPWIVAEGKSDDSVQREALRNLKELVCSLYAGKAPAECNNTVK